MTTISWDAFVGGGYRQERGCAMTVGVFDGVHRGHRALLRRIAERKGELVPAVVTFSTSPKLFRREGYGGDISSLAQKLEAFSEAGAELVILIDFSVDFGKLGGKEFVGLLRDRGNLRYLAVGNDFRCGHRLDTGAAELRAMNGEGGVQTDIVDPVFEGAVPVSSSRIRALIGEGRLVEASSLLGRNFEIDLGGAPTTPGLDLDFFDVRAAGRITPPNGRYPVSLIDRGASARTARVVDIVGGSVGIPRGIGAERVEFVT